MIHDPREYTVGDIRVIDEPRPEVTDPAQEWRAEGSGVWMLLSMVGRLWSAYKAKRKAVVRLSA